MPADDALKTLRTDRLLLRPMTPADVGVLAAMQVDPEVMAHYGNGQPLSRASAEQTVLCYHTHCHEHGYWAWAVTRAETGEVVGQVTAGPDDMGGPGSIVLGFILRRSAWGFGYGPEAVGAVIRHGLEELSWPIVAAGVSPANTRSIRLCERVGMKKVREELNQRGDLRWIYTTERKTSAQLLRA